MVLHICCEHGSQDDLIFESALKACFENESVRGEVRSQMGLSRTAICRLGHVNNPLSNFKKAAAAIWRSTLSDADLQALFELYHTAALGSKVCEPTEDAKQAKKARPAKKQTAPEMPAGSSNHYPGSHWSWGVHSDHWHWAGDRWHC